MPASGTGGERGARVVAAVSIALATTSALAAQARAPFEISEVAVEGRSVAAELADLDGDGRGDLFVAAFRGVPPDERRVLSVYYQRDHGALPAAPDETLPLPAGAAAYDLFEGDAGAEVLLLRPDRLTALSFAGRHFATRDLPLPAPALHFARDERGLDRMRIVQSGLGAGPRFLVPGLGRCLVLDAEGAALGLLEVGARANYFHPPRPGPLISESEAEMYLDFPRLHVGDVDGDGRGDVVATGRHEVRVFLQRDDGRFSAEPSRTLPLSLMGQNDHVRGSGSVRSELADIDGDGRVDLVVARASGGLLDVKAETRVHLNRGGGWALAAPDQRFTSEGGAATIQLVDLDGDGRPELVDARIPVSVVEIVELLVTRSLDVVTRIHRAGANGRFEERPWIERSFGIALDFNTFRPGGFVPTLAADLNADGYADLLSSGDGEAVEVFLGGPRRRLAKRNGRQPLESSGRLRLGHYDRDGLPDFVLYNPRAPGSPVRVGVNRGVLEGTRARPGMEPRSASSD